MAKEDAFDFVLEVLALFDEWDLYDGPLYWATHGAYAPITFFIICNDLFHWASADAEVIEPGDVAALRQAVEDVRATGDYPSDYDARQTGCLLWCARKRGMRPQRPAYPDPELTQIRMLFDACGPARHPRAEDWYTEESRKEDHESRRTR